MSDIERVPVDIWRNPDQTNRVAAGTVPIGDYEIQATEEQHTFEGHVSGAEPYMFWGDGPKPKRRGRPRKSK